MLYHLALELTTDLADFEPRLIPDVCACLILLIAYP